MAAGAATAEGDAGPAVKATLGARVKPPALIGRVHVASARSYVAIEGLRRRSAGLLPALSSPGPASWARRAGARLLGSAREGHALYSCSKITSSTTCPWEVKVNVPDIVGE